MNRWTYINNSFVAASEAYLHVSDLAIQRGYGVFDYLKTIDNKPIFLEEHIQRFLYSAKQLYLPVQQTPEELSAIIQELVHRHNMGTSGIRLTLTGGYSPDGYNVHTPNLIISQSSLKLPTADAFENGIRLATYEHLRQLPQVKSINYLMAVWLQPHLKEKAADDVLYHLGGVISECPRANFFLVKDNVLITPDTNILLGITRQKVIDLAKAFYKVEIRPVALEDINDCQEAFITSTTKQILPVSRIDDHLINGGKTGPVTQQLYKGLVELQMS
ncbi:MAG TPA: aminotransferase class IV [Flavisolibacter sp.]|nr:aminotransferase class IV [Flavisolibacter sp.]